ncbi:hypothetical protein TRVA0_017S01816 [Trichomonascus vanleenenianus]|uniref:Ctk3p n=1 Tax=Trichomonascus vanleenenianus TaxID=2268995 RepID=UPI003ECA975C
MLQKLNASVAGNDSAVQFMLKREELQEDLYSCILEELETSSVNVRMNIAYLIEHLCTVLLTKGEGPTKQRYCMWLNRDLMRISELIAPPDSNGKLNQFQMLEVLESIRNTGLLEEKVVDEVLASVKARDYRSVPVAPMSNDEIMKRMNEDRERSKRPKESIWAIDYKKGMFSEFEALWAKPDDQAGLTELDYEQMKEDNEIVQNSIALPKAH